jgi:hypothetical protein
MLATERDGRALFSRPGRQVFRLGLVGGACLLVCACADISRLSKLGPAPVDPSSPLAARVTTATSTDFPTPSFKDVPPVPTDVRTTEQWKAAVRETQSAGPPLQAWVAENPQTTFGTEQYAEAARASIPAGERVAPPPDAAAAAEAYAARLRAEAAPPPPPK